MDQKLEVFLLLLFSPALVIALSDDQDFLGLKSFEWNNTPPNWDGSNPCGDNWEIIKHGFGRDLSYNKDLTGSLPQSIGTLKKLTNFFSGQIPAEIGSLKKLVFLSLNSNRFGGVIPPSIGNLSQLYWLDLADNNIAGPIPVSNDSSPGLDMLHHCKHFHFGKNKLTGPIPDQLFSSDMKLIHVLFESNELSGSIPSTLGLVQTLEVVRLDDNKLTGEVPTNFNNLTQLTELFLSKNKLSGHFPNLTGMDALHSLDISNNSFDPSDFPSWYSTFESLTTLVMEDTGLRGQVPVELFSLPNLESVILKNNLLNGTLDLGNSHGSHLWLIDLQSNSITDFKNSDEVNDVNITLARNPICDETTGTIQSYCSILVPQSSGSYVTAKNCLSSTCNEGQISSLNCQCAYPYTGTLVFRAPSFSDLGNPTYYKELEKNLMSFFQSATLPVDSVSLSNPTKDQFKYLEIQLEVFPHGRDRFNRTEITDIGFALSNQTYKPPSKLFGPFFFNADTYENFADSGIEVPTKSKSLSIGIIIGAVAGGSVLLLLLLLAGVYVLRQKRRAERATELSHPFGRWDPKSSSGSIPQLKGARWFSLEELKKYTNNFSTTNAIGSGGYGKVYRGNLPTGELIAVKRAQKESMQGGLEFKNEIELLSRVHHKNLVSLTGFCFEQGEQMLIYEFVPNGTLKDSLSGKSGIKLDWMRRLKVALGTARGLSYLHELANPPIIHRDIKSTNVLLDDRLNAKVSDFGLSKLMMGNDEKDHVTTQVKGTMGYLDPEYYMTQQLTEKSDVYSFGVLMLELITARKPIERGKYVVREVRLAMDRTKELYNLQSLIDSSIGLGTRLNGFNKFVDLAMRCVAESGVDRPIMSEVVKEIETIMQLAGLNPNADSASNSASYEESTKPSSFHPYGEADFDHSGSFPSSKIEPH
ncbi:Mitogen-activated protein kinase kinase kinase [Parasponia andersonii]|uniref:non-specific serine/threonine protein kinase n=1 Tax=Parasponia andersonii TaxID=3476 RepID=A0A2P5AQ35_PARAD|nr:Mitogen-activated protein kinase kinase kinase [Parasponia andersonii]